MWPLRRVEREIEKEIHAGEKSIKRNWKRIVTISVIAVLLISAILFITGMRIRFALRDSLIVGLSPSDRSFTITNQEQQPITFEITSDNSRFCTASCSATFHDRSEDKILDAASFSLGRKDRIVKSYTLTPKPKGTGQKIYNFEVECSNQKSLLCRTDSPLRQKSSFITLNFRLSPGEEMINQGIQPSLQKSFSDINTAAGYLQTAAQLIPGLLDHAILNAKLEQLNTGLNETMIQTDEIFSLWSDEEYTVLQTFYAKTVKDSTLLDQSTAFLEQVRSSRETQNDLTTQYNQLKNMIFSNSNLAKQAIHFSPENHSLRKDFNTTFSKLSWIQSNLTENQYTSLAHFDSAIANLTTQINEFNATLSKLRNKTREEGNNLAASEFQKKCSLGFCDFLVGDPCLDLNKILTEYDTTAYPIPGTPPAESYFETGETSIKITPSNQSLEYYTNFCVNATSIPDLNTTLPDISESKEPQNITTSLVILNELSQNLPVCCVRGSCSPCCTTPECRNDPSSFPVLLIHGHSLLRSTSPEPVIDIFNRIQYQLQEDGYLNGGTVIFDFNQSDYSANDWGLSGTPIALKASYYFDYFYSLGKYIHITRSTDNIDTYAIRLKDIIELVKFRTGKPKVNIVAHSMGGLVSRRYLDIFGEESVDNMVLIATPNHGIEGSAKKFCRLFGEKRECEDMYQDSILLKKLNDPNNKIKDVKVVTISGIGCDTDGGLGDGIVTLDSSKLEGAESSIVEGNCDDTFKAGLHSDLLNIDKYPEVYQAISSVLRRGINITNTTEN